MNPYFGHEKKYNKIISNPDSHSEVIDFLRANNLSKEDYINISYYTGLGSQMINRAIMQKPYLSNYEEQYKSDLVAALHKVPSLNNQVVYRNESHFHSFEDFLEQKKEGDLIKFEKFLSTFQEGVQFTPSDILLKIYTKSENSNAKDISLIGTKMEKEALFICNTSFRILEIDEKNEKVILEEI